MLWILGRSLSINLPNDVRDRCPIRSLRRTGQLAHLHFRVNIERHNCPYWWHWQKINGSACHAVLVFYHTIPACLPACLSALLFAFSPCKSIAYNYHCNIAILHLVTRCWGRECQHRSINERRRLLEEVTKFTHLTVRTLTVPDPSPNKGGWWLTTLVVFFVITPQRH